MAPHPPDLVGLLLAALIATVVVTPVLSLLVLWWYRRAVGRSMRADGPAPSGRAGSGGRPGATRTCAPGPHR